MRDATGKGRNNYFLQQNHTPFLKIKTFPINEVNLVNLSEIKSIAYIDFDEETNTKFYELHTPLGHLNVAEDEFNRITNLLIEYGLILGEEPQRSIDGS